MVFYPNAVSQINLAPNPILSKTLFLNQPKNLILIKKKLY